MHGKSTLPSWQKNKGGAASRQDAPLIAILRNFQKLTCLRRNENATLLQSKSLGTSWTWTGSRTTALLRECDSMKESCRVQRQSHDCSTKTFSRVAACRIFLARRK
jgi:hypothetical protein